MKGDAERFIEALVGVELMAERSAQEQRLKGSKKMPVVTVSRHFGALGKTVAQALADRLHVRCFDRTILSVDAMLELIVSSMEKLPSRPGKQILND